MTGRDSGNSVGQYTNADKIERERLREKQTDTHTGSRSANGRGICQSNDVSTLLLKQATPTSRLSFIHLQIATI